MNNKAIIAAIAIVIVVVILGYFLYYGGNRTPSSSYPVSQPQTTTQIQPPTQQPNVTPAPADQQPAQPTATEVIISNFAFSPQTLTVIAGATVKWTNNDSVTHTIVSDSNMFNSGNIAPGQSFQFSFKNPGTYSYHCSIHPNMTGSIIVK